MSGVLARLCLFVPTSWFRFSSLYFFAFGFPLGKWTLQEVLIGLVDGIFPGVDDDANTRPWSVFRRSLWGDSSALFLSLADDEHEVLVDGVARRYELENLQMLMQVDGWRWIAAWVEELRTCRWLATGAAIIVAGSSARELNRLFVRAAHRLRSVRRAMATSFKTTTPRRCPLREWKRLN